MLAARNEVEGMKGHLDTEQLKSMKREDLQALAKDLGVGAGGKNEEIIARLAAVEVEVTEESQSPEGERPATEAVQPEEEPSAEQPARDQEEAVQAEENAADEQKAGEEAGMAAGQPLVRIVTRFLDKRLNQIKDAGETYTVSSARAVELVAAGVAEIIE